MLFCGKTVLMKPQTIADETTAIGLRNILSLKSLSMFVIRMAAVLTGVVRVEYQDVW